MKAGVMAIDRMDPETKQSLTVMLDNHKKGRINTLMALDLIQSFIEHGPGPRS